MVLLSEISQYSVWFHTGTELCGSNQSPSIGVRGGSAIARIANGLRHRLRLTAVRYTAVRVSSHGPSRGVLVRVGWPWPGPLSVTVNA